MYKELTYQSDEDSLMDPSGASLLDPLLLLQWRDVSLLLPLPFEPLELECFSWPKIMSTIKIHNNLTD